jgi:lipopolysaccharide export system permease protein
MMQVDRYGVLIDSDTKKIITDKKAESLPITELWTDRTPMNMAEFLWRISFPIMCVLLMLLAVPLAYVNPRSGRSANFLLALFLCIFYYNMVQVSGSWVSQSKYSLALAWWPIHLFFVLLIMGLFSWRQNVNSRYHPLQLWARLVR